MNMPGFTANAALFPAAHRSDSSAPRPGDESTAIVPQRPCQLTCGMYSGADGSTHIACYCGGVRVV